MVYVDNLKTFPSKEKQAFRVGEGGGHQWCHMWADTLDELHRMAGRIGMREAWFQNRPSLPHYDLTPSRRAKAIHFGAIESDVRPFIKANQSTNH